MANRSRSMTRTRLQRLTAIAAMALAATAGNCPTDPPTAQVTSASVAKEFRPASMNIVTFVGDTFSIVRPDIYSTGDTILNGIAAQWQTADASTVSIYGTPAPQVSTALFVPRRLGTTTITATTSGVKTVTGQPLVFTANVTVAGPPAALAFSPRSYVAKLGDVIWLSPRLTSTDGRAINTLHPRFTFLEPSIVNSPGGADQDSARVVALGTGVARVVATTVDPGSRRSFTDTAFILVVPTNIARVAVQPATADVFVGGTLPLQAVAFDASGASVPLSNVTWSSSDVSMATVSGAGVVTALSTGGNSGTASTGTVQLSFTTPDGRGGNLQASATITIHRPVATVQVTPSPASLPVGQSTTFSARLVDANGTVVPNALTTIAWKVSDPTIATIDSTGRLTALKAGSTTVSATTREGASGGANLTVTAAAVPTVLVTPSSATLQPGSHVTVSATVVNATGTPTVTWATRNATVASITPAGNMVDVAGGAAGSTYVVATYVSGTTTARDSALITVAAAKPTVKIVPSPITLAVGTSAQMTTTVVNPVAGATLSIRVLDPTLIEYSPSTSTSGSITGKGSGTTSIVATYTAGGIVVADTAKVTVTTSASSRVARVILEPRDQIVTAPTPFMYRPRFLDALGNTLTLAEIQADGGTIRYFNTDDNVATVVQGTTDPTTAQVTPKGAGRENVTLLYTKSGQAVASDNTDLTVNPAGTAGNYGSLTISTPGNVRVVRVGQSVTFQVVVRDPGSVILTSGVAGLTVTSSDPSALPVVPDLTVPNGYFFAMTGRTPGLVTLRATVQGAATSILVLVIP